MKVLPRLALAACTGLSLAAPARAAFEKEQAEIDRLVAARKVQSAAAYILEQPELRNEPRFLRQLTHLLVEYYAYTLNFRIFALRDLEDGEDIEKIRGTPGSYTFVRADLEQLLHDALEARPEDPDILFAVGEYLSVGKACGCHKPELFQGKAADEYTYLETAYKAGRRSYWSLFRMGVHHLAAEPPDLERAVALFDESLKEKPDHVPTHYNMAIAHFWRKEYAAARQHARRAAGRYGKPDLDADTYNVLGRAEAALGDAPAAEKALARALELRPAHDGAFTALLDLLRSQKRFDEYRRRAAAFVALDYANTWPFGVYLRDAARAGLVDADRELARDLAGRAWTRLEEIGAVFYSLGNLAEIDGDRKQAHAHYRRSLEALRKQENPPKGSVEALTALVARTDG